jgi:hypothetical protein
LENEVDAINTSRNRNEPLIENTLDTLLSISMHGVGDELFIKLLNYYKTVNSVGLIFY